MLLSVVLELQELVLSCAPGAPFTPVMAPTTATHNPLYLANVDVLGVDGDISVLLCCKVTTGLLLIPAAVCVRAAGNEC